MNTQLKKLATFSAAIFAVTLLSITSPVYAQRDAGAKARGDFESFWGPRYQSRSYSPGYLETRRSFSYQPQVEARQSFSYEPAPFHVGDKVIVSANDTKLMKGTDILAVVKKGETFEVGQVEGPWLGAEIAMDGNKFKGWIWHKHVASADQSPAAASDSPAAASQPQVERRSFSYEPSYRNDRSDRSPGNEPWQFQKTDPRRYRP